MLRRSSCSSICRSSRHAALKSRTSSSLFSRIFRYLAATLLHVNTGILYLNPGRIFELKFVRDFRDLSTRPGKRHRARSQFDHCPTLCHSYVSTVSFTPESAPSSSFCLVPSPGFKCMMRFLNPGFICSNSSSFKQVRDFSAARQWAKLGVAQLKRIKPAMETSRGE